MGILPISVSVHHVFMESPRSGVVASYELPCGCWGLNPGPLEEETVLLTTGPSLQSLLYFFMCRVLKCSFCLSQR